MTSTHTVLKLRDLIRDIEHGKASEPLLDPLLLDCLRSALCNYTDNMTRWAKLSRQLESIECSIEWDASAGKWALCPRRLAEYHFALNKLRRLCEAQT